MREPIPLSEPYLGGNEWKYLKECLDTNSVAAAGPFIGRFERALAEVTGAPHVVAVSSGTAALHLAMRAIGLGPGDEVLTPDFTFAAPANAVCYTGAVPVFLDVDTATAAVDPAAVRSFLDRECDRTPEGALHRRTGRRVRALLAVHLYGHPADLDPLWELADRYGLVVIEDAAESLGAKYKGVPVGGRGHISCFSFNGNKVITAGAGGAVAASRKEWVDRARHLATQARAHPTEYVHDEIGFNYRMPSLNAALGLAQVERLEAHLARKREMSEAYARDLGGLPGVSLLREQPWARSSCWLSTILVEPSAGRDAATVSAALRNRGVEARRVWVPLHAQAPFRDCPFAGGEGAEWLHRRGINLPGSVGLGEEDRGRVVSAVREILRG